MSETYKNQETTHDESRRKILLGMGAVAATAYAGVASSAKPGHDHSKHSAQLPDVLDDKRLRGQGPALHRSLPGVFPGRRC